MANQDKDLARVERIEQSTQKASTSGPTAREKAGVTPPRTGPRQGSGKKLG